MPHIITGMVTSMKSLGLKDVSDWIKIIVVLLSMGIGYAHLTDQVDTLVSSQALLQAQEARIERYLSSRDPKYWETAKAQDAP